VVDSNVTHIQDYVLSVGRRGEIVLNYQDYEPVVRRPVHITFAHKGTISYG